MALEDICAKHATEIAQLNRLVRYFLSDFIFSSFTQVGLAKSSLLLTYLAFGRSSSTSMNVNAMQ